MSETRRFARTLVERSRERFASRHSLEESLERLRSTLARRGIRGEVGRDRVVIEGRFAGAWQAGPPASLEGDFLPSSAAMLFIKASSILLVVFIAASAWVLLDAESGPLRSLVPLATAFAILGFPFVVSALGAQREAAEARIRKALRIALLDEEARLAPPQHWEDEE